MNKKFVFVCLTPYQVFITYSYINELKKHTHFKYVVVFVKGINPFEFNKEVFGFEEVVIVPELFTNSLKRFWKRLFYGGILFKLSKLSKIISKNTTLLIYNDTEPVTWKLMKETKKKGSENNVILIEEGVGLYNLAGPKKRFGSIILKSFLTKLTGNEIKFRPIGLSGDIDTIIAREPAKIPKIKIKNKKLLKQSIGGVFSNDNIMKFVNNIIKNKIELQIENNDVKTILFLGQPICHVDDEVRFLTKLFKVLPNNIRIIVKPHPRDNMTKYKEIKKRYEKLYVMDDKSAQIPVELLFSIFSNSLILTYNSSAGINAKYIVPTIKVCYLYKCINESIHAEKNKIDIKSNQIMEELISEYSIIPNNFMEIEDFVNNWLKQENKNMVDSMNADFNGDEIRYFCSL